MRSTVVLAECQSSMEGTPWLQKNWAVSHMDRVAPPLTGGHARQRGFGRGDNDEEEDGQPVGERLLGIPVQVQFHGV